MIPLKRKAVFSGQETYRLNPPPQRSQVQRVLVPRVQVRSHEQRRKQNTEWRSHRRTQERATLESLRARNAEDVVALARERYRLLW